jgi:outer membrane protein TolC
LEDAEDEKNTVIDLLKTRIDGKRSQVTHLNDRVAGYRSAFEAGRVTESELLSSEQKKMAAKSELKELDILLEHYENVGL